MSELDKWLSRNGAADSTSQRLQVSAWLSAIDAAKLVLSDRDDFAETKCRGLSDPYLLGRADEAHGALEAIKALSKFS